MNPETIDIKELIEDNIFREDTFLQKVKDFNWGKYQDKKILVKGCGSTIIPPWAYMTITGRLSEIAKSVRYGNEHDNILVYRKTSEK